MGNAALNNTKRTHGAQRGQGTLELTAVLIAIILLVGGIMQFWFWSNNQVIRRQINYNVGRTGAGKSPLISLVYEMKWPLAQDEPVTEDSRYSPFLSTR